MALYYIETNLLDKHNKKLREGSGYNKDISHEIKSTALPSHWECMLFKMMSMFHSKKRREASFLEIYSLRVWPVEGKQRGGGKHRSFNYKTTADFFSLPVGARKTQLAASRATIRRRRRRIKISSSF